jgi:hypothetical protein
MMVNLTELIACVDQRWSPVIGDPTFMGWATVIGYFAAALACLFAGWVRIRDKRFWFLLAVFLFLLGVNKELDLQSALTATGRCIAQIQGWYDQRRTIQIAFILALLCISAMVMTIALYRFRRNLGRVGLALLGFSCLITFVAVRAVGFHHFDQFINWHTNFGLRMNWLMELTGIIFILINALFAIAGRRRNLRRRRP